MENTIRIGKRSFVFDVFDVEDYARYAGCYADFRESVGDLRGMSDAQDMLAFCEACYAFFDALFGEGASESLFSGKHNVFACVERMAELLEGMRKRQDDARKITRRLRLD